MSDEKDIFGETPDLDNPVLDNDDVTVENPVLDNDTPEPGILPTNPVMFYGDGIFAAGGEAPANVKNDSEITEKRSKGVGVGTVILCVILAALIGAGSATAVALTFLRRQEVLNNRSSGGNSVTNISVNEESESAIQAAAQKATPSIVGIRTTYAVSSFFGGIAETSGEGSGVIYSQDGYIITNYHVVESAVKAQSSSIKVFFEADDDGVDATVVGYNISNDIAVIKVNKVGLTPIEIAKSSELKTGQYVAVIGCPGGIEYMGSVTYGVISGLNRKSSAENRSYTELIQTDAAINPGNSGGAMVNTKGQLVGVPSSKIVDETVEGMGFAIPSDLVEKLCKEIINKQNEPSPYIGITVSSRYDSATLNMLGYPAGAVVQSVAEGSPAEKAGIRRGDIVTKFSNMAITEYTDLATAIDECSPGQTVAVQFFRNGRTYSTSITLEANN